MACDTLTLSLEELAPGDLILAVGDLRYDPNPLEVTESLTRHGPSEGSAGVACRSLSDRSEVVIYARDVRDAKITCQRKNG